MLDASGICVAVTHVIQNLPSAILPNSASLERVNEFASSGWVDCRIGTPKVS
jgi:hypothetical protein